MMTALTASLVVLMSAQSSAPTSASPQSQAEPRQIAEGAMKFTASNDMPGLFAYLGKAGPIDKKQIDDTLKSTITQRKTILGAYGKSLGYQFINECRRGEHFSRVLFAEKRENMAIRWEFVFYKSRDKWLLITFTWDDKIKEFFVPC